MIVSPPPVAGTVRPLLPSTASLPPIRDVDDLPSSSLSRPDRLALSVWSEFVPYPVLQSQGLDLVQRSGVGLYLAIHHDQIGNPELLDLLRQAQARGIEVRAWLLLPDADGYWPNALNAHRVNEQVLRFLAWTRSQGVTVPWIILDMEPPLSFTQELVKSLKRGRFLQLLHLLRQAYSPVAFRDGEAVYQAMVADLHRQGVKAMAVTTPLVLDDLRAGNRVFQEYGQIPVSSVPWDELSFMVYRSAYDDFLPGRISPRIVYEYARDASRFYPGKAAIAVGIVGTVSKTPTAPGMSQPAELAADIAAARAAGVDKVHVFSFDGILQMPQPGEWLEISKPGKVPPRSLSTGIVRGVVRLGNRILKGLK